MLFVIRAYETATPEQLKLRLELRPDHLARLQDLKDQQRLLVAGPLPAIESTTPGDAGFQGSIIIAEFASAQEAQQWLEADPFITQKVYSHYEILPFIKGISAV